MVPEGPGGPGLPLGPDSMPPVPVTSIYIYTVVVAEGIDLPQGMYPQTVDTESILKARSHRPKQMIAHKSRINLADVRGSLMCLRGSLGV